MAAITALEALDGPSEIEIVSDSMYLTNCGSRRWERRTNRDLWERLDVAAASHQVEYRWIRGHTGNPGNEHAHELVERILRRGPHERYRRRPFVRSPAIFGRFGHADFLAFSCIPAALENAALPHM